MATLAKAEIRKLDANFENEIESENWTTVQFNPETLKVSFANQVATPSGSGDQRGTPARQFVGAGTTKLAVQLWFDVGAQQGESDAVDRLSDRELEVLELIGKGNEIRQIGKLLHLSPKTVETHRAHIKEKLNLQNARQVARFAVQWVSARNV